MISALEGAVRGFQDGRLAGTGGVWTKWRAERMIDGGLHPCEARVELEDRSCTFRAPMMIDIHKDIIPRIDYGFHLRTHTERSARFCTIYRHTAEA